MKKMYISIGIIIIVPFAVLAQSWESMNGPFFVHNATGISVGWDTPGQTFYAYAVASDLLDQYFYTYNGSNPISAEDFWVRNPEPLLGAKHVSASRYNARSAYATVPEGAGTNEGVHITTDGGNNWRYDENNQPGNVRFTGITAHPGNPDFCFTSGELDVSALSSVWRTTDAGGSWTDIGHTAFFEPRIHSNSVVIDPNSGNDIDHTTIYVNFFEDTGCWKNTHGGDDAYWEGIELPEHGMSYNAVDVAVKVGIGQDLYLLIWVWEGMERIYELWHTTDAGISWGDNRPFYSYETTVVNRIFLDEFEELGNTYDAIWAIADNGFFLYNGRFDVWGYFEAEHGPHFSADIVPIATATIDPFYLSGKYSIQKIEYDGAGSEFQIHQYETVLGTNKMNVVSIDACQSRSTSPTGILSYLRTIGYDGGYIVRNLQATSPGRIFEWETEDYFQRFAQTGIAYGDEISSYYNNVTDSYIASGTIGNSPYLIDTGIEVDRGQPPPPLIGAVTGPHYPTPGYTQAFTAGQNSLFENVAWFVDRSPTYQLVELINLSANPPVINDITHEIVYAPDFYICGSRTSDNEDIAAYVDNDYPNYDVEPMNGGLGNPYHVRDASSIVKSEEIDDETGLSVLYLGTEKGIFKNHFEPGHEPLSWYPANYGISSNVAIEAMANYYHVVKNWPYGTSATKPDSVVQFALGYDLSQQPYIYLSPDSGRSWNEIGHFFRTNNIAVNDITTFTDIRETSLPTRSYLGAGTDDGVYKLPYNVRSGEIVGAETWDGDFYIINRDLTISEGASLTIGPNTTVLVLYDYPSEEYGCDKLPIVVDGRLEATGVTFKSSRPINPQSGDWQGFLVREQGELNLTDCTIDHATDAITAGLESNIEMTGCTIANSDLSGITAIYPGNVNIAHTGFANNNLYAISIMNENAIVSLTYLEITGINRYGIRYFGNSPNPNVPLIDEVTIAYYQGPNEVPPPYYGIELGIDEQGYMPKGRISNVRIDGYEDAIHLSEVEGTILGPGVECRNSINGILIDKALVEIDGSEGANIIENNEYAGLLSSNSAGKVRSSMFIGGHRTCIDIEENGDVIDFGREEPEEDWGNNWIEEGPEGTEMLFYVNDCVFDYPAQMNWWGSLDPQYIDERTSECVIWDPFLPGPPESRKLASEKMNLPENLTLSGVYPNPFNALVTIKFILPKSTTTSVTIYNILGQEICELYNQYTEAGEASVIWNGKYNSGEAVASGIYLYAVRTDDEVKINKMTLLK